MRAWRKQVAAGVLALSAGSCAAQGPLSVGPIAEPAPWRASEIVAVVNGRWFDGRAFRPRRTVYIVDGRLAFRAPRPADRTVDLGGAYVTPPLGDAHTHVFDGPRGFAAQRSQYLTDGVFYALTATAPASGVLKVRGQFSGPKTVDVVNAQAGFTGPNSHPAEIYNAYATGVYDWREQHAKWETLRSITAAADDAYFVVRNAAELEAKWRLVEQRRPDMIKVFLRGSERYRPEGPPTLADGGMDPALLPLVVRRAHAAGLRVAVANNSLSDFRTTLAAGADLVTHLPCYQAGGTGPYREVVPDTDAACLLQPADARAAARAGLVTTLITSEWAKTDRPAVAARREAANTAVLRRAGAPIALGTDAYGETPTKGMVAAARAGMFDAALLLRWATMDTPKAIFPARRVGCLAEGCEASFLVLGGDPLQDLSALEAIRIRVKDGLLLTREEIAPPAAR